MMDSFTNAFWDIQLEGQGALDTSCANERQSPPTVAEEASPGNGCPCDARPQLYSLHHHHHPSLQLSLQPLPASSGVFSPLGGAAWFGAALLASILENNNSNDPFVTKHVTASVRNVFRVLELGSGAVGLSGIVLGLQLAHRLGAGVSVVLTDNEPDVLDQLRANIALNVERIEQEHPDVMMPHFSVEHLDWGESTATEDEEEGGELDMIIGSELVYTDGTARACFQCINRLLRRNHDCLVVLMQTSDRQGWNNVFIRSLQDQKGSLQFRVETQLPCSLYETASALVQQDVRNEPEHDMMCVVYIWNSISSKFAGFGDLSRNNRP